MRRTAFVLFLAFFLLPAATFAQEKAFNAESFTLDNGLQVVLIPNHRAPVVSHMVWYKTGAIDEDAGESGLAHFVEHLMFKGTQTVPPGEFSKRVRALGGNDNAFTSQDYTAYYQNIAARHLEAVMRMEADRMTNLTFPPDEVLSERKVVLEERRERTDNDPRGYFYEQLRAALFVNHPYGNPVIGWLHEVDALDRENVTGFYKRWYAPNNAVLVVSGDVTLEKFKPLAEEIYGTIPALPIAERSWTTVPPLLGLPRLIMRHPAIHQPVLQRLYRVPSYRQSKDESLALQVLQDVLDGSAATRLYKSLVVEQKLATGVSMDYSGVALSDGTLGIGLTPAEGVSLETLEAALDKILRDFATGGPTDDEMREAKDRLIDKAIFALDSIQGPAMIFGRMLAAGGSVNDVEYWPAYIEAVTAQQVRDAAAQYLNPDSYGNRPYVTGYLLPQETATAEAEPEAEAAE